jgi:hypothetical protein
MTRTDTIELVVGACVVLGLVAYVGLILVPAWTAYSRLWERLVAAVLSLYIAAAMVGVGLAGAAGVVYAWDRFN